MLKGLSEFICNNFDEFFGKYRKTPKILLYRACVFVNFCFLFTTTAGFSECKPMGLFSVELILEVKNKFTNAWAYFLGGAYIRGWGLFSAFYGAGGCRKGEFKLRLY